jgi:hypothetical protein
MRNARGHATIRRWMDHAKYLATVVTLSALALSPTPTVGARSTMQAFARRGRRRRARGLRRAGYSGGPQTRGSTRAPITVVEGGATVRFIHGAGAPTIADIQLIPVRRAGAAQARSGLRPGALRDRHGRVGPSLRPAHGPGRAAPAPGRDRGARPPDRCLQDDRGRPNRPTGRFSARLRPPRRIVAIRGRFAGDSAPVGRARAPWGPGCRQLPGGQ